MPGWRTRVATTPDIHRIGAALASPGMDTRTWISLAVVTKVFVDSDHGFFADITLLPSQHPDTAYVGSPYAAPNVGECIPLNEDDLVVVANNIGEPDEGLVVMARLWNLSDPPPAGWNNDSWLRYSTVPQRLVGSDVSIGAPVDSDNPGANNKPSDAIILGSTFMTDLQKMATALSVFIQVVSKITPVPLVTLPQALAALNAIVAAATAFVTPTDPALTVGTNTGYLSKSATVGK